MGLERIQKILARAGVASRREAERMILEGRVSVNGQVVDQLGLKADPVRDHIKVDGKRILRLEPKRTVLLNKPRGYLSTVKDPLGRPTVKDLLQKVRERLYPIGRLDFDAEGLLLLTNDGELAHQLTHPKYSIPRTYWAKVEGHLEQQELLWLKKGVMLEDGEARVNSIRVFRKAEKSCWVEAVVTEGRNHLVKRIFSAVGHPVVKLKRVKFGPIRLGDLPVGHWRPLTEEEKENLRKTTDERRGKREREKEDD